MNSSHGARSGSERTPPANAPPASKGNGGTVIDAGLRSLDHYKRTLPKWRYKLRQRMLPLVRWETPYLAYFQSLTRSPTLDSYFAITANLGTHTFFMIGLPILYWCGFVPSGAAFVRMLASGVLFTGFIKDMLSLPRPLSPPLHRITMSGSVALEYGFPSTHSTNAVSVAVYGALMLRDADFQPSTKLFLEFLSYFYAMSIVVGRLYCGMHGFVDVIIGSLIGVAIGLLEFHLGPVWDAYLRQASWLVPLAIALAIIVLIRIHPEPADDCPCFDDSVAFAGVVIGCEDGVWFVARSKFSWLAQRFSLAGMAPVQIAARLVLGVVIIFAWREVMKPTLLKTLPHLFRIIETHGFNLPRRFFVQASEYDNIPEVLRLRTDNVLPGVSDFPNIVNNLRKARRGRSVSIGPQSAADAYETLAYRERRRRESMESQGSVKSKSSLYDLREQANGSAAMDQEGRHSTASGIQKSPLAQYEEMMGQGTVVEEPSASPVTRDDGGDTLEPDMFVGRQDELGEKEMFEKLVKPRVRYDVEVVTKLIVYAGIGLLAVDLVPLIFEYVGLGAAHLPR